ncbi:MAG TPA: AAA family ATPase [Chthonomonadaceae bacterium]|nr:AAA family ATPase [Chthonomonadaceae bacterium]
MYLKRITLKNIRGIRELVWEAPADQLPGWHVILGDNGSGKSAFLFSTALALVGPREARMLPFEWKYWLHRGEKTAQVSLELIRDNQYDEILNSEDAEKSTLSAAIKIEAPTDRQQVEILKASTKTKSDPDNHLWNGFSGWFSAGYGPYRRFYGSSETARLFSFPRLGSHLTLFEEGVNLITGVDWLIDLRFKQLEDKNSPAGKLLDAIKNFINQTDFLPYGVQMGEVTSDLVEFQEGNGYSVAIEELSDGYRAILSLTLELFRQLSLAYGADKVFDQNDPTKVAVPGVVLIDEIDAHLHPTWQQQVGVWFRTHFPQMQFLVATHSPLVCQAATVGSVYRLPQPGTDERGKMVTGVALDRLLYGDVLEAYSTELFGAISRSAEGEVMLDRLAELNIKALREPLSEEEREEQLRLRASLPIAAYTMK